MHCTARQELIQHFKDDKQQRNTNVVNQYKGFGFTALFNTEEDGTDVVYFDQMRSHGRKQLKML